MRPLQLRELALRPNIACKLSGLPTEADRGRWTADELKPYVAHALDCFGTGRVLYGSDWPVVDLAGGHGRWLAAVEELLARVRAHLRTPVQAETTRLRVADIELDMLRRTVSRDGSPVHLSAKEFDLLAYFMRHPGQVLSREQILNGVWDYNHDPGTNIVEVYVGYLRRKLALTDRPVPIQTVRSAGYRLVDG